MSAERWQDYRGKLESCREVLQVATDFYLNELHRLFVEVPREVVASNIKTQLCQQLALCIIEAAVSPEDAAQIAREDAEYLEQVVRKNAALSVR